MADDGRAARILAAVEAIPPGRVMTYGDVAEYIGAGRVARLVGHVLAADGGTVPWHRVVHANGRMSAHLVDEQTQRLRAEGVSITNGKVDLRAYRWTGH
jgi:methylated-DNA-protein-cysteine methyltransferase-like protein